MGRLHNQPNHHHHAFLDIPLANGSGPHARKFSSSSAPVPPLHLTTTREEATRVQLQEQRLREADQLQNHAAVVVSQKIPGFKTSAAFFASLRTNLRLNASPPSSACSTPPSMRASTSSLPPPSPLSFVTDSSMEQQLQPEGSPAAPEDPLAGVPELNTYQTDVEEEKIAALRLVADSVAQMRQTANSALMSHWLNLAVLMATIALLARYMLEVQKQDALVAGTTCTGLVMLSLVLCRFLTQPYIEEAERIDLEWLGNADVIVTKFGDEIIGTVVIDWVSGESRQRRKKAWRAEIKGWTVRLKYRGKGVGAALLETAVKESRKKGAETIEFSEEHANSKRILPGLYNSKFDQGDKRAHELLQDLLESSPARGKKK